MVLGLLSQLKIFWQLCLIELQGLLPGLGLIELYHLIYPKLLIEFGILVLFTKLGLMEFQVRYLALFLFFSVMGSFGWFWMGILHNDLSDDVICNIAIYAADNTLYSKCDHASDL